MRVAGALVPDLHPVSLTSSASAVLCCKGPLRYILRFVAYPDVGGWGCGHKQGDVFLSLSQVVAD